MNVIAHSDLICLQVDINAIAYSDKCVSVVMNMCMLYLVSE